MTVIDAALVTDAVLALLRDESGLAVGDGETPAGYPQEDRPHAELYHLEGGALTGPPFTAPEADAALVYQVSAVGWRRDQAEKAAARLRNVLLGRDIDGSFLLPLDVPGWAVQGREADGAVGGAEKQGDLWVAADRYRIAVTPL